MIINNLVDVEDIMATAEQIKSLISSYSEDAERFYTIALQVAAHEAQLGHGELAHDIRNIIDKAQKKKLVKSDNVPQEFQGLILSETPDVPKSVLVIPTPLLSRIERIIHEYRQSGKLKPYGLSPRRKIMLIGIPGTGKTLTARVLAHELRLPLFTVQADRLVTKFMGETSAKLRQIFDLIQQNTGVYLFDEFDALGGERSLDNDVGEMRRVLNSFLQFIEQDKSDSLIITATNSPKILDRALFRRFDDVLYFELPPAEDRKKLIQKVLSTFLNPRFSWKSVITKSEGLSHAEIDQSCRDAVKYAILNDKSSVDATLLSQMLTERQNSKRGQRV
jgi:AAA+ superfamily predicted ATPase